MYVLGVDAGLSSDAFSFMHWASVGYQMSNNAGAGVPFGGLVGLIPHHRVMGEWNTQLDENYVDLSAVAYFDTDFSVSENGTGRELFGAIARLSARIA